MNKTCLQSAPLPSAIEYATEYGTFQDVAWVDCDAVDFAVNFVVDFAKDFAVDFKRSSFYRPEFWKLLYCRKPSPGRGMYPTAARRR